MDLVLDEIARRHNVYRTKGSHLPFKQGDDLKGLYCRRGQKGEEGGRRQISLLREEGRKPSHITFQSIHFCRLFLFYIVVTRPSVDGFQKFQVLKKALEICVDSLNFRPFFTAFKAFKKAPERPPPNHENPVHTRKSTEKNSKQI